MIDPAQRERLADLAEHNVVRIDLPAGEDPYASAAEILGAWRVEGAVVRDDEPAIWALTQEYTGPDGAAKTRRGFFARVRVEDYGPGRIRPHERTHPGPKEDRLRLTRATKANLSPIFALYSDPSARAWTALAPFTAHEPWATTTDDDGTTSRLWRVADPEAIAAVQEAAREAELLIADGHHRYETARVYADEIGGEGAHRFVLMNLVAMEDEGLTVFPTHRLVSTPTRETQAALRDALHAHFDVTPIEIGALPPPSGDGPLTMGYLDAHHRQAFRLVLKDQSIADARPRRHARALPAPRHRGARGAPAQGPARPHRRRHRPQPRADLLAHRRRGDAHGPRRRGDLAFFLRPSPVRQVQEIAATGVNMPPKSTYFFPKVPTGLLFHPLS